LRLNSAKPSSQPTGSNAGKSTFQTTYVVFWAAFLVRVLYITIARSYHFRTVDDHFFFGYEMGRIASSLATGHGFGNPFDGYTGPTTWVAPLYPLLLSGVFKIFGVYSLASGWVILTINSLFSALTTLTIYEIAARTLNRRTAAWSSWIWALYPAFIQYAVRWVWEMSLSTWLFSLIVVVAQRMRGVGELSNPNASPKSEPRTLSRWLLFGLLWGLLALSNPSLLLFLPAAGLWILHGTRNLRRQWSFVAVAAAIFLLCISPWAVRNALVFHRFIPMRANFGAEFYLGNGPGANGFLMEYNHPYEVPAQLRLYGEMGEVAYAQMRGRLAWQFVASDPRLFMRNSIKRAYFFWISVPHATGKPWYLEAARVANFSFFSIAGLLGLALALKRHIAGASIFAWAFLLAPLVYYFVTAAARFRHPLEPLLLILTVYLFQAAGKNRRFSTFPAKSVDALMQTQVSLEG
jgi:4-amino-4-deoxy-L-arabinose transferase-like glycosyltransferase